ncbi:MAG: VWA domain-containing protein [Halodesulfurarchaeum sp.]|nr:VWA domain-containing protein [Halodesulfurarchaeum sp.]
MVGFGSAVPFPEIVGQERLKRVLLAVAANDAIDGLLVRGEKGTAKSTAVRGLVDLLPTQRAIADCPYGCPPDEPAQQCESCRGRDDPPVEERPVPLVTVPLGATRERVVGSLSLSDALDGESTFEPGLLAQANRGFLYVDEVNLLEDHLVDVLLDAAASGVNRVERDGMSETHPAEFTLIGTMNPEEGDLRPQLRDRFALQVDVAGSENLDERVAIVEAALDRERDDSGAGPEAELDQLQQRIEPARARLQEVSLPRDRAETIAEVCVDAGVDGHRGDIAAARAARTFAALDGRDRVTEHDVEDALEYALPHRLQSRPFEETEPLEDVLNDHFGDDREANSTPDDEAPGESDGTDPSTESGGDEAGDGGTAGHGERDDRAAGESDGPEPDESPDPDSETGMEGTRPPAQEPESGTDGSVRQAPETPSDSGGDGAEDPREDDPSQGDEDRAGDANEERSARPPSTPAAQSASVGESAAPELAVEEAPSTGSSGSEAGRVESEPAVGESGPRIRTEPAESAETVDVAASVRENAKRGRTPLERRDLRQSVRAGSATTLVVFAVDASASMGPAMRAAKGTVLELLKESYQERDEVAFVAFAGAEAEVLLPPTDSVSLAARHLKDLPTGDRTPLPAGLDTARAVIERADPAASVAVVVTDGRTNVAGGSPTEATREAARALGDRAEEVVVVDASQPGDRANLVEDVVAAADATAIPLEDLSTESVRSVSQSAGE